MTQIVEVAAGLSPRGLRFSRRYGERLTYIEADLPGMVERKRAALERIGSLSARHRVEHVDAVADAGPGSSTDLTATLDSRQGLAIVTEGLLGYLERDAVLGIWRRFARHAGGLSARAVHLGHPHRRASERARCGPSGCCCRSFVRGRVHLHFGTEEDVVAALREAGFAAAEVRRAADVVGAERGDHGRRSLAHIIEADHMPAVEVAMIDATLYSDPACPWAYSENPALRVIEWRYGRQLHWRLVLVGLTEDASQYEARGYTPLRGALGQLRFRGRYGMPFAPAPKPRLSATARACRAVVAAGCRGPARSGGCSARSSSRTSRRRWCWTTTPSSPTCCGACRESTRRRSSRASTRPR